jgi:hypothetical protein
MQSLNLLKLILCFSLGWITASPCWAQVDTQHTKVMTMPQASADTSVSDMSQEIMPKEMDSNESSSTFMSKLMDNSFSYWFNNSGFKDTSVGRAATAVEKKMKADVDLGSDKDQVSHKLSFKVLASQALAKLEYTGWFKAAFNYDARASKAEAELLENLSNNKDLIVSHSITSNESKSQLSLRWNW